MILYVICQRRIYITTTKRQDINKDKIKVLKSFIFTKDNGL